MATRRRRSTPRPVEVTPEPTHEEMLEVAAEREVEAQVEESPEEEEKAIEALMAMAVADTFEAIWEAEEEKGISDFFDPSHYQNRVTHVPVTLEGTPPAVLAQPPRPAQLQRQPRYLLRENRHPKYNQG